MLAKLVGLVLVAWAGCVSAMMPEGGIWWNPNEPGSGYTIEIQDNVLAFSAYSYDAAGNATWYTSAGTMTGDRRYTGSLSRYTGGQCLTCSYRQNSGPIAAGTVDIQFDTPGTATLTLNGSRVTRIERTLYGMNGSPPYMMLGEWSFVIGTSSFPVYYADRISFSSTYFAAGKLNATGYRTGSADNFALARKEDDGSWSVLIDSSPSYYNFYLFSFSGLNGLQGRNWVFLKSESLSGPGTPFIAFRSGSARSVNGNGPALPQSVLPRAAEIDYDSVDGAKARQQPPRQSLTPNEAEAEAMAQKAFREMLTR